MYENYNKMPNRENMVSGTTQTAKQLNNRMQPTK